MLALANHIIDKTY